MDLYYSSFDGVKNHHGERCSICGKFTSRSKHFSTRGRVLAIVTMDTCLRCDWITAVGEYRFKVDEKPAFLVRTLN